MQSSRIIEVDGVFLGAAVALPNAQGWQIVATDDRVGPVNGQVAASWTEAQRLARHAFFTWRPQAKATVVS
jgi:hypothetical protein